MEIFFGDDTIAWRRSLFSFPEHCLAKHQDQTDHLSLQECAECEQMSSLFYITTAPNTNTQIFTCKVCSRAFKNKALLTRHISIVHSTNRPFACDKCEQKFKSSSNLKVSFIFILTCFVFPIFSDLWARKESVYPLKKKVGKINCPANYYWFVVQASFTHFLYIAK